MKSEILVKSTAALDEELEKVDKNAEDKSISELLDEVRPAGVPTGDDACNGENKEEV